MKTTAQLDLFYAIPPLTVGCASAQPCNIFFLSLLLYEEEEWFSCVSMNSVQSEYLDSILLKYHEKISSVLLSKHSQDVNINVIGAHGVHRKFGGLELN